MSRVPQMTAAQLGLTEAQLAAQVALSEEIVAEVLEEERRFTNMEDTKLGALDVLFLVVQGCFIAMKLMDKLDWSWWWVMSPVLVVLGLVVGLALLAVLGIGTARSGGHVMAFFRRRSRLRRMYEEDPAKGPAVGGPPPAESQWWRE